METLNCPVEVRESATGPMLHGVLIQEGRAASTRAEIFAPYPVWFGPVTVFQSAAKHLGVEACRGQFQRRETNGEILQYLRRPAPPALVAAFNEGRKFFSVEFHADPRETRSKGGRAGNPIRFPSRRGPRCMIPSTTRRPPKFACP